MRTDIQLVMLILFLVTVIELMWLFNTECLKHLKVSLVSLQLAILPWPQYVFVFYWGSTYYFLWHSSSLTCMRDLPKRLPDGFHFVVSSTLGSLRSKPVPHRSLVEASPICRCLVLQRKSSSWGFCENLALSPSRVTASTWLSTLRLYLLAQTTWPFGGPGSVPCWGTPGYRCWRPMDGGWRELNIW